MTTIELYVQNQKISVLKDPYVVADSLNDLQCHFQLSDEWAPIETKVAIFSLKSDLTASYKELLRAGDVCPVPNECCKAGTLVISVFGGDRKTVNEAEIVIHKSGYKDNPDDPLEPTPSLFAQLVALVAAGKAAAEAAAADAALSEYNGGLYEASAAAQAQIAIGKAAEALLSAQNAETSNGNANQSALDAAASAVLALNNILNGVSAHNLDDTAHQDIRILLDTVRSIALGAAEGYTFVDYPDLVTKLNAASRTTYSYGRYLNVLELEIPDLWISAIMSSKVTYTYTTDDALVEALSVSPGQVQIGYYKVAMSETKKVILTDYPTKTEVAAMIPIDKTRTEYDALYAAGQILAGRYYAIDEGH